MNMREYVISNFKDSSLKDIEDSVNASIESGEEDPLLGLGVLFELCFKSSSEKEKEIILNNIKKELENH